jgi:hypothetical protein
MEFGKPCGTPNNLIQRGCTMNTKEWWVSCNAWTCYVETQDKIIIDAAPILRRFIGQPSNNLKRGATKIGGFKMAILQGREGQSSPAQTVSKQGQSGEQQGKTLSP